MHSNDARPAAAADDHPELVRIAGRAAGKNTADLAAIADAANQLAATVHQLAEDAINVYALHAGQGLDHDDAMTAALLSIHDAVREVLQQAGQVPRTSTHLPTRRVDRTGRFGKVLDNLADAWRDAVADDPKDVLIEDYAELAAAVDATMNPSDGDGAASTLLAAAVIGAAEFIESLPCTCPPTTDPRSDPCDRCAAIGRDRDQPAPT